MLLVTGGMGFIGSHTVVELLDAGYDVVIIDNLSNSKPTVLDSIKTITGKIPYFYKGDIRDIQLLEMIFSTHTIDGVFHFAAKKSVGESCEDPWEYYEHNVGGLEKLTKCMHQFGCHRLLFSSSCTVYDPLSSQSPFDESAPTGNSFSPYGTSKYMCEQIIHDLFLYFGFSAINLRYFNATGAHQSGLLGEDSTQPPTYLLPVIFEVLQGKRTHLEIFGESYNTHDGTCLRDYIHVVDLALAHIAAWKWMSRQHHPIFEAINIGTGSPTSVKELVAIVEKVTTKSVYVRLVAPRSGDVPVAYADPVKANTLLGWTAKKSVEDAVVDGWRYREISSET